MVAGGADGHQLLHLREDAGTRTSGSPWFFGASFSSSFFCVVLQGNPEGKADIGGVPDLFSGFKGEPKGKVFHFGGSPFKNGSCVLWLYIYRET